MKKLFLGFLVLISILILAGVYFWFQNQSSKGVSLELTIPEDVQTGVTFDLIIDIINDSRGTVSKNELSLNLPAGIVRAENITEVVLVKELIPDLEKGQVLRKTIPLLVVGGENSIKNIRATLSYETGSIRSRFEAKAEKNIVITKSGIFVDIVSPTKILSGEEFQTKLLYRNDSESEFDFLLISFTAPTDFTILDSSEEYEETENIGEIMFAIGELKNGDEGEITLKGVISGQEASASDFTIQALVGEKEDNRYQANEKTATLVISPAPLSMYITLGKDADYAISKSDQLTYRIQYKNNTDIALKDVIIKAFPEGDLLDLATIQTKGFLQSSDNSIIWNASRESALTSVAPGAEGFVMFSISTRKEYPIISKSSKNFLVTVSGEIESPTVPRFVAVDRVFSTAKLVTKVKGDVDLTAQGYFQDPQGSILNGGSMPLKVGQATRYTIHWQLQNKTTDVTDIVVKAFLGPNVRYTGTYQSNNQTIPVYNERTQELIWRINKIAATEGTLTPPIQMIFQVEITPSISQAGDQAQLIQETQFRGVDAFTGQEIFKTAKEITTVAPGDPTIQNSGRITE